jgi:predicted AlkP superfamily pyrophosphatase or phosphodiesterase
LEPLLPDYSGPCLSNVLPALLARDSSAAVDWLPPGVASARQVVLLALDGLGWEQLQQRTDAAPFLSSMAGGPITTVAPSTTATCLTSLTTGLPPAAHGVIGYRVHVGGRAILNVLRWRTADGDARELVDPEGFAPQPPFRGLHPPVVTRAEFSGGGFSGAHLRGARHVGWRMPSTLVAHVRRLLVDEREPFVYCYYDGVDKVAHEYGLGAEYDEELAATDALVARLASVLPPGAALVITSDHGQVDVGPSVLPVASTVLDRVDFLSGEGRFLWLHARPGCVDLLADSARSAHSSTGWVRTLVELESEGWFGGRLSGDVRSRVGDVALIARDPIAYVHPDDPPSTLVSRHGSVTPAEMLVPLVGAVG